MSQARAERPELVARFRGAGLTQRETAETLGVSRETVQRHDEPTYQPRESKASNAAFNADADVVDAELVEWFCEDCGGDGGWPVGQTKEACLSGSCFIATAAP